MSSDEGTMESPIDFKSRLSDIFTRASPNYDQVGPRLFSYFGTKLVQYADIKQGSTVLDIACGRGAILFPAVEAVSAHGTVIGIDIATGMVEQINREILSRNIDNAHALVMDAERLDFPASWFDYVLCGLCLFFFPNLEQALTEFIRVLKPRGFIVASTFKREREDERTKEWNLLFESFKDRVDAAPAADTYDLDTAREITRKFQEAGFAKPEIVVRRKTGYFTNEEEWWEAMWSQGSRSYLERIPSRHIAEFRTRAFDILKKRQTTRGFPMEWELLFSKAQKEIAAA